MDAPKFSAAGGERNPPNEFDFLDLNDIFASEHLQYFLHFTVLDSSYFFFPGDFFSIHRDTLNQNVWWCDVGVDMIRISHGNSRMSRK